MHRQLLKTTTLSTFILCATFLAACGGGGGNATSTNAVSVTPPPAPQPAPPATVISSAPTFTPGVFESETLFEARCETPRPGTSDVQGSTVIENFWLRSWSNNIYLFFEEIADVNPADFTDRLEFFATQRTQATTASGAPRDQFHFNIPTDEFQALQSGGMASSFGFEFRVIQGSAPREIRIIFVEPNSPAADAGFIRGDLFIEIDGVDAVNGTDQMDVDTLNSVLFNAVEGESHNFIVQEAASGNTKTASLASEVIEVSPVNRVEILNTPTGDVGYVLFNTFSPFSSEDALFNAFTQLRTANIDDLVLDLRYNGGGLLAVASQLAYMVAGDTQTRNRIFEDQTWNSKHPLINPVTGRDLTPLNFIDEGVGFTVDSGVSLPAVDLPRVFVLSTSGTCSASESVINGLRGIGVEVILVGTRTCGKPYGFFPTDNCGETYFTLQFQGNNALGFGDYADGFSPANSTENIRGELIPGCEIADDFLNQLGSPDEALLAAALQFRADGTCPAPLATSASAKRSFVNTAARSGAGDLLADPRVRRSLFLRENRILTPDLGR